MHTGWFERKHLTLIATEFNLTMQPCLAVGVLQQGSGNMSTLLYVIIIRFPLLWWRALQGSFKLGC